MLDNLEEPIYSNCKLGNSRLHISSIYIISDFLIINNPLYVAVFDGHDRKHVGFRRVGAVSRTGNSNILGIGLDRPIPNIKRTYQTKRA